jgi:nucleoside-diphosphate-sugar epimerase
MELLVPGASGFLGRNLLIHAPRDWRITALYCNDPGFPDFVASLRNPKIVPFRCDLANPRQVEQLFANRGRDWDCCLYLAAKVDIPWSVREPRQDLLANTGSLLNVLEHIRADKFVYFSSGAVYEGLTGEVHPRAQVNPTLPYAISKLAAECYVQCYGKRKGSIGKYLIVRFFGAYGPYEAAHKIYTRLIEAFSFAQQRAYQIYGDGQNLIDAMYVEDAVDAIRRMLTGKHWNDVVNLAGGNPVSIERLVRQVAEALGVSVVRVKAEGIAHESNQFFGSTREMRELFGFEPRVSIPEGVKRFKEFLDNARLSRVTPGRVTSGRRREAV